MEAPQPPPAEALQIRLHGPADLPTLIYLPGLHGDWTLASGLRHALAARVRFVEFTYPRTLTWSLADYAAAISEMLLAHGITRGWLLGESFGSQIVWPLLQRGDFIADGVILAGGFVKHPVPLGSRIVEIGLRRVPLRCVVFLFQAYGWSRLFRRHRPSEFSSSLNEFLARRTELDRQAMVHRLRLITANDPREIARAARLPVYFLSGFFDPIVPWPFVRAWLRRHCPGFREARILGHADHTVLSTGASASAEQIVVWLGANRS